MITLKNIYSTSLQCVCKHDIHMLSCVFQPSHTGGDGLPDLRTPAPSLSPCNNPPPPPSSHFPLQEQMDGNLSHTWRVHCTWQSWVHAP